MLTGVLFTFWTGLVFFHSSLSGAKPLETGSFQKNILQAIKSGNQNRIQRYLVLGNSVNSVDRSGMTLLHYAAEVGQLEMVKFLIKNGADPSFTNEIGNTPMHVGVLNSHLAVVKYLIAVSPEQVNVSNVASYTPLHSCAAMNHIKMVQYLVENGADVNALTKHGNTPYALALKSQFSLVAEFLARAMGNPLNDYL